MKKLILKLVMILFTISGLMNHLLAQAPEGIIYQAEARDGKNLIPNQALDVKIAIIQDVPTGTVVFEESHKVTTNDFGMFVLVIGQGSNTLGLLLENVDWGNHFHFLNVQVKKTKATVWINMGTSQLLSVPYALHAKTATEAFTADYNYLYNVPTNISHFNNDAAYITAADITDTDPTNEIQDLQLVDNILTITKNGNATQIDLSFYATATALTTGLNKKVDKVTGKGLSAEDYTTVEKGKVANLSGVNTGDQDISAMTHTNREALDAVTGINTGDQDLSGLASTADLDNKVDKVAGKDLFPTGTTPGQMKYWSGTDWVNVAPGRTGQTLTFCNGIPTWGPCPPGTVTEVTSTTGAIWMDRNLGASQVATSSTDEAAYGDLYQWGRGSDGHEKRNSGTTYSLSSSDTPGHGDFIIAPNPYVAPETKEPLKDWRSPQNTNLWQGVNGINNPCPNDFRIPTEAEFIDEMASWSSQNAEGAFGSSLKLTVGGFRSHADASINSINQDGVYWSSTVDGNNSRSLVLSGYLTMSHPRANGFAVRCIKDAGTTGSIPTVTTSDITNVEINTATGGGEVTSGGGTTVTARGVCWSTAPNPTIDLITKTEDGTGIGSFTSSITGLSPATVYYVRAYAINSVGTAYGDEIYFTTIAEIPSVTTSEISNIETNTATGGGEVTSDGFAIVTARGVCWSTSPGPTIDLITKTVDGTGTGTFTSSITGLLLATTYYVRAYATNSVGTAYGNEVFFTTPALAAGEVYNPTTGKIWMDRNLGASQVATSSTDAAAYGDLYQWGRGTDGHQIRTSGVTTNLSSSDSPGHSNFIANQSPDYDWRSPQNNSLWQGVNGINNPCPSSYRLPTDAELNAERLSWSSNNTIGAFTSQLKLTTGGYRNGRYGGIEKCNAFEGYGGYYCSSTVAGVNSRNLSFDGSSANINDYNRSYGLSVRCIKD